MSLGGLRLLAKGRRQEAYDGIEKEPTLDENDQFGLEPGSGSNQSICKDVTYISKKTEMISEGEFRFQAQKCISSNGVESIIFEPNLLEFEELIL